MTPNPTYEVHGEPYVDEKASTTPEKQDSGGSRDVFAEDDVHQIQYKTLSWQVRLCEIQRNKILIDVGRQPPHDSRNRQQWYPVSPKRTGSRW
jgi:hypothetical protein